MSKKLNDLSSLSQFFNAEDQSQDAPPSVEPSPVAPQNPRSDYTNPRFDIISIFAYLIGVDKKHFTNDSGTPKLEVFDQLERDKDCRIIRNLCLVRNAIERNYGRIVKIFREEIKNIGSIPDLVPVEALQTLTDAGIKLFRNKPDAEQYIITINIELSNRIETVSCFVPEWVKWDYVKPLFLMEKGTRPEAVRAAGTAYSANLDRYPYRVWLNWDAVSGSPESKGNILYNDEKFLTLIYIRNEDRFTNLSLVRDVGNQTMHNFNDLLDNNRKCIIVVDCENSDPIKLAAALSSLSTERLHKINKILLFDSHYTTPEWVKVEKQLRTACSDVTLEHIIVDRLNESKSQVDMTLAVRTTTEVYTNGVDGIVLFTSDSDYWAMISQLKGVDFIVMLERRKTGSAIIDTLLNNEIRCCFIDDFCTSASYWIKTGTLNDLIQEKLDELIGDFNLRQTMDEILADSWIRMSPRERENYYDRYLKKMKFSIAPDGAVRLKIEGQE